MKHMDSESWLLARRFGLPDLDEVLGSWLDLISGCCSDLGSQPTDGETERQRYSICVPHG